MELTTAVLVLTILAIFITFAFDFLNGFHDAANAIATVVATKVLTPGKAIAMAAFGNFIGMIFITNAIAETIGKGIVSTSVFVPAQGVLVTEPMFFHSMAILLSGLVGAIAWDIITWVWGLPTSSSHALIGGLMGAALVAAGPGVIIFPSEANLVLYIVITGITFLIGAIIYAVYCALGKKHISAILCILAGLITSIIPSLVLGKLLLSGVVQVLVFMVAAPIIGLAIAFIFTLLVMRGFRRKHPGKVNEVFNRLQLFSSFFYSITHGTNDAQKGMGIITLVLIIVAVGPPWGPSPGQFHVPIWVILGCHAAISLGTLFGGWRIVRTMGQRVTALRPYQGFCAETGGGIALAGSAIAGIPVSTTHVISSAIMGVGATRRLSAVRWGVTRRIVLAWIITIPASALIAIASYGLLRFAFGL